MSLWCLVYQVVEVAEDVGAEQGRADGEDVEVELVVGKNTHVPVLYHNIRIKYSSIHQFGRFEGLERAHGLQWTSQFSRLSDEL